MVLKRKFKITKRVIRWGQNYSPKKAILKLEYDILVYKTRSEAARLSGWVPNDITIDHHPSPGCNVGDVLPQLTLSRCELRPFLFQEDDKSHLNHHLLILSPFVSSFSCNACTTPIRKTEVEKKIPRNWWRCRTIRTLMGIHPEKPCYRSVASIHQTSLPVTPLLPIRMWYVSTGNMFKTTEGSIWCWWSGEQLHGWGTRHE